MSGRGRGLRANSGTSSSSSNGSSPAPGRSTASRQLGGGNTSTRSSSGSPSQRTRSLTPSSKKAPTTGVVTPKIAKVTPTNSPGQAKMMAKPLPAEGNPMTSPAPIPDKRRSSAEERRRKSRRPKFQDNPPAPEIVEKKALQLASANEDDKSEETAKSDMMDVDEDEEEVDDDEEASLLRQLEETPLKEDTDGCETTKTNGVHHDTNGDDEDTLAPISETVSSLVDDIVKQIDSETLNGSSAHEAKEEGGSESLLVVLGKELKQAVSDFAEADEDFDEALLTRCLINRVHSVFRGRNIRDSCPPPIDKVALSADFFRDIFLPMQASASVTEELAKCIIQAGQLKTEQHNNTIPELKKEETEDDSSIISEPPELLSQVDGVDSSAETRSEDPKDEDKDQEELKEELDNSETMKCDKQKILSEMENKFAKETQNALKHRPVYKKRNKSESWDFKNGSEDDDHHQSSSADKILLMKEPGELEVVDNNVNEDDQDENMPLHTSSTSSTTCKSLRKFRKGSRNSLSTSSIDVVMDDHESEGGPKSRMVPMSPPPPPLTPEVGPSTMPLRIDIPDHYSSSTPSFSGGYPRLPSGARGYQRLLTRTPPAARSGMSASFSEAVVTKEDAEVAATAIKTSPVPPVVVPMNVVCSKPSNDEHPSLKIRLPKVAAPSGGNNLVITSTSVAVSTPHHKKVPKRRNLQPESDGVDTEEEVMLEPKRKKLMSETISEPERSLVSADEETDGGGKTTPDSQITSDDKIMVPEKASSFKIHPERTCSDCCFYCRQKFGLFDTPLHISQMKSQEIQKFAVQYSNCSKDACLCDKCYRLVDRNARTLKREAEGESSTGLEKVRSCIVRNCNKEVTHTVNKKWLHRLKKRLIKKFITDWDRIAKASMKSSFPVCTKHNTIIEYYSNCGLCKKKLSVNAICCLRMNKIEVQELNELLRADSIPAGLAETMFVCKLCKTFCGIKQKAAAEPDYLKTHKNHKLFLKEHKRRLYSCLGLDTSMGDDLLTSPDSTSGSPGSAAKPQKKIHQVSSQSDNPTKITIKTFEVPSSHPDRPSRKRRQKEFASPNSDSRIIVVSHDPTTPVASTSKPSNDVKSKPSSNSHTNGPSVASVTTGGKPSTSSSSVDETPESSSSQLPMCSITISFDLNTQKLWEDLHSPYENYTSFFRHLILLEKYFRNGDLVLSDTASTKASNYFKSIQNRIEDYEVKHKRSKADLSASTRPDLSVPPAPNLLHLPFPIAEPPTTRQRASSQDEANDGSTILRIPKVSMPSSTPPQASPPPMPTKIRVRDDLMYIGLMAKESNIMTSSEGSAKASSQLAELANQAHKESNLMQILNDPTLKQRSSNSNKGPTLGKTSLVATSSSGSSKSSNSQLFKNSDSSGSSAIPLTFNNSIAEVLAAAAKSKSRELHSQQDSSERKSSEVTITAKSTSGHTSGSRTSTSTWSHASEKAKSSVVPPYPSPLGNEKVNPLMDMSKLLQKQPPGIAPHIIAQNTLAMPTSVVTSPKSSISTHQMAGTMPKIAPKPNRPIPVHHHHKPPQVIPSTSTSSSMLHSNKKSLNNILDRLSGMKSSGSTSGSSSSASSLVQQLQAPPIMSNPGLTSPSKGSRPSASSIQQQQNQQQAALSQSLSLMASQGLLGMGYPGSGLPQPLYPWTASPATSPQQQAAMAEAQRALSMAGAGLPGMNQAAAAAAMAELMKISLHAQQQVAKNSTQQQQQQRIRAPPPLTHMGRPGSNGPNNKPKPSAD